MSEVAKYYDQNAHREWDRLSTHYSQVEFETTMYLIKKYFPVSGKIMDIGSGPGRYSVELASMGYDMTLVDISKEELKIAEEKMTSEGFKGDYIHKSATDLSEIPDDSFDGVLLLGPMYHLHELHERLSVLHDVRRILKDGGTAIIAYINTLGVLKSSVFECPDVFEDLSKLEDYMTGDLKLSHEESFTTAYFTTPENALEEVRASSLHLLSYAGAESFLSGMHLEMKSLYEQSKTLYKNYLEMACRCCEKPEYRQATEHLTIVVRK
ncbi:bifunctional 2-polyprenyl-6-hydroxyphenol methylase/3-demethylubiquinol 3-O-methyltransferase UbiG [Acidaminobacter sp. JC074]|uniref:class I SAM-dependent methyltransferase n=1 Tax=Acidaminobacter sp. JC074 TaxID=2530199 RepID=UPI001F0E5324|nr:class I SAM-dependent methyltransferase [Acidaminobacter sp. JC074]